MMIVISGAETKRTDGDVRANDALVLLLKLLFAFTRGTLESKPVLYGPLQIDSLAMFLQHETTCSCNSHGCKIPAIGLFPNFVRFLLSPLLGILLKYFEAHRTPVTVTEWTL